MWCHWVLKCLRSVVGRSKCRSHRDALSIHQLTAAYDSLVIAKGILGGFTEICMKQAMVPTATGGFATGM